MSEEETIKSFKSLMYNAKANWEYFNYEILFNFFSLYNNAIEENKKLRKENEELKSKNKTLEELLQGNLYELYKYYKELAGTYQGNSVPIQKVKAKIEELDIEISTCEYADDDSEEYKQEIEKNKAELLIARKVLQQLLDESERMNYFDLTGTKEDIE